MNIILTCPKGHESLIEYAEVEELRIDFKNKIISFKCWECREVYVWDFKGVGKFMTEEIYKLEH